VAALTLAILSMITVFDMWPFNRVWPLKGGLLNGGLLNNKKIFSIFHRLPQTPRACPQATDIPATTVKQSYISKEIVLCFIQGVPKKIVPSIEIILLL
jgi:hypothetical protein